MRARQRRQNNNCTPRILNEAGTHPGCHGFLEAKRVAVNDPSYWAQRAQDTRRLASQMQDAVAKEALLAIAKTYERIGAIAQTRNIGNPEHFPLARVMCRL